jgi:DNA-binding beta-propeller fold protein YncE
LKRHRLFVAALGNDTVEVLDVERHRHEKSLAGFGEPQGVLYLPDSDRLYVANGTGGRLDILDGNSLAPVKRIAQLADADNVRYDHGAGKVVVGYGKGALQVLDPGSGEASGEIRLPAHPESFQLERNGSRIFVNVPEARDLFFDAKRKLVYVICGEGRVDVFRQDDADRYSPIGTVKTASRARTGLFVPEEGRLYVAAPALDGAQARILVYRAR